MAAIGWDQSIAFTLHEEGGLVDNPNDPGGLTNYGISQRAYPGVDIRGLNAAEAAAIYRRDYWNTISGDELPAGVDLMVFDMGVNAGISESAKLLQGVLGVTADGAIGPMTLLAARGADADATIVSLYNAQLAFYQSLAGFATFGAGWSARCSRRRYAAYVIRHANDP